MKSGLYENSFTLQLLSSMLTITKKMMKGFFFFHYGLQPRRKINNYITIKVKPNVGNEIKKNYSGAYIFYDVNKKQLNCSQVLNIEKNSSVPQSKQINVEH